MVRVDDTPGLLVLQDVLGALRDQRSSSLDLRPRGQLVFLLCTAVAFFVAHVGGVDLVKGGHVGGAPDLCRSNLLLQSAGPELFLGHAVRVHAVWERAELYGRQAVVMQVLLDE